MMFIYWLAKYVTSRILPSKAISHSFNSIRCLKIPKIN